MKKAIFTLCFLVGILVKSGLSQGYLEDSSAIVDHTEEVMDAFENGNYTEGFSVIKRYWQLPENEISQLEGTTISQLNTVANRFGEVIGSEFIKEQEISNFLVNRTYALRFERHALRVNFRYYKNDKGWQVNHFKWDDQLGKLFDAG